MSDKKQKQAAAEALAALLGVPTTPQRKTSAAAKQLAAMLGVPDPTPLRESEPVERSPSPEMREVIEDVLRGMKSRGELE